MDQYRIAVLVGSLRRESFNRRLAQALTQLAPVDFWLEQAEIGDLPLYNQDDDGHQAPAVLRLKTQIADAQGLLFVTPEYNRSVPGLLKNAIDQASRPYGQSAWTGKPTAIMGAGGGLGTARSQYQFRLIAHALQMRMVDRPEIFVANSAQKFDAELQLTDPVAKDLVAQLMVALRDLARR